MFCESRRGQHTTRPCPTRLHASTAHTPARTTARAGAHITNTGMNDKQGTSGSKHRTKHVSRPPPPPKHTTTPTNRGKKRKAEEPAEVLNQLQTGKAEAFLLKMAEAQTALNAALAAAEEATTTLLSREPEKVTPLHGQMLARRRSGSSSSRNLRMQKQQQRH